MRKYGTNGECRASDLAYFTHGVVWRLEDACSKPMQIGQLDNSQYCVKDRRHVLMSARHCTVAPSSAL
jgi:hypothetical protein